MKLVLDSSTLISLSGSCLMEIFVRFVQKKNIEVLVPPSVYTESIINPLSIKRFELSAIRIKMAFDKGKISATFGNYELNKEAQKILSIANNMAYLGNRSLKILHYGEAEVLALAKLKSADAIATDERTARVIAEDPLLMKDFLEKRYGQKIRIDKDVAYSLSQDFKDTVFVRSAELVAMAYQNDCFSPDLENTKKSLEAAMYACKFSGCAISFDDIEEFLSKIED